MRTGDKCNLRVIAQQISNRRHGFKNDEDGSLVIFSLFIFIMILFVAGMAVDMMRYETRRVAMQNTLDGAILAASSLKQEIDAEELVKDHFDKAGFGRDAVTIDKTKTKDTLVNDTILVGRTVNATTDIGVETLFMGLLGVDSLNGDAIGTAKETVQNVEISLIVDISGSMGNDNRMVNLKVAAKKFIDTVYLNEAPGTTTSVSIIPYNATVVVGEELLNRLNAGGQTNIVDPVPSITGARATYPTGHSYSTCVRFEDDDFKNRDISNVTPLVRVSHFKQGTRSFNTPSTSQRWCNEDRQEIMVHETDPLKLKAKIEALSTGGWTGIDNGMKWGVALLDPAIEPVIRDMVDKKVLSEKVRGRPATYDRTQTMKVVVLLTDGDNTIQRDLKSEFKFGPTRIWHAESLTSGYDNVLGRERTNNDGFLVRMPDNSDAERWYVPGSPTTTADDYYIAENAIPSDANQQIYQSLYERFAVEDLASFFFEHSDTVAYNAHKDAVEQTEGYSSIDTRLQTICDEANKGERIRVFAIGFEAPEAGLKAMRGCASSIGNYFNVQGTDISKAFDSIAGQIAMLRLTE